MNTNIKYNQNLYLLLVFSFIIRIVAVYYYGDTTIEYEWKTILKNLNEHGTLSLYSFDGRQAPSVFMPPLYIFFLFTINFFTPENIKLAKIVLAIQIILSILFLSLFLYKGLKSREIILPSIFENILGARSRISLKGIFPL